MGGCPTQPWDSCVADVGDRMFVCGQVFVGMLAVKFLVSNWLSPVLMGKNPALAGDIKQAHLAADAAGAAGAAEKKKTEQGWMRFLCSCCAADSDSQPGDIKKVKETHGA